MLWIQPLYIINDTRFEMHVFLTGHLNVMDGWHSNELTFTRSKPELKFILIYGASKCRLFLNYVSKSTNTNGLSVLSVLENKALFKKIEEKK